MGVFEGWMGGIAGRWMVGGGVVLMRREGAAKPLLFRTGFDTQVGFYPDNALAQLAELCLHVYA